MKIQPYTEIYIALITYASIIFENLKWNGRKKLYVYETFIAFASILFFFWYKGPLSWSDCEFMPF